MAVPPGETVAPRRAPPQSILSPERRKKGQNGIATFCIHDTHPPFAIRTATNGAVIPASSVICDCNPLGTGVQLVLPWHPTLAN